MGKKRTTKKLAFTNGKRVCTTPTQPRNCRPARLMKKMVMAGPVPIIIVVFAQMVGEATFDASLRGTFTADFTYDQFIGFNKLSVGIENGRLIKSVELASRPTISKSFSAAAGGSVVASVKVGAKVTAIINGATLIANPYIKLIITGRFHARTQSSLLQNTAEVAVQDKAKTGCQPGAALTGDLEVAAVVGSAPPSASEVAKVACAAIVGHMCNTPGARAANCLAKSLLNVDPCAKAGEACDSVAKEIAEVEGHIPKVEGTFGKGTYPIFSLGNACAGGTASANGLYIKSGENKPCPKGSSVINNKRECFKAYRFLKGANGWSGKELAGTWAHVMQCGVHMRHAWGESGNTAVHFKTNHKDKPYGNPPERWLHICKLNRR